jgi:hypothetical protein
MKGIKIGDIASYSVVEVDPSVRGAYCLHHKGLNNI